VTLWELRGVDRSTRAQLRNRLNSVGREGTRGGMFKAERRVFGVICLESGLVLLC
jgi:hypothetical protein